MVKFAKFSAEIGLADLEVASDRNAFGATSRLFASTFQFTSLVHYVTSYN